MRKQFSGVPHVCLSVILLKFSLYTRQSGSNDQPGGVPYVWIGMIDSDPSLIQNKTSLGFWPSHLHHYHSQSFSTSVILSTKCISICVSWPTRRMTWGWRGLCLREKRGFGHHEPPLLGKTFNESGDTWCIPLVSMFNSCTFSGFSISPGRVTKMLWCPLLPRKVEPSVRW